MENAEALAEFFNRTRTERIVNFSLFLSRSAPLCQDILAEARLLLELLETHSIFDEFHDRLELRVWGMLPQDREKMLQKLDEAIAVYGRAQPV